ncbi:hypothetical protein AAE478_003737 [Parahypoxylon ruwenzoriense]
METVSSIATTAARAVWGENKQNGAEPISGQAGDTSKGEPFDAGNIEDPKAQATKSETSRLARDNKSDQFSKDTGKATEAEEKTPDDPSAGIKLRSTPKDTSNAQNDVRNPENPRTNPKTAPTDVNDAEDGPNEAPKLDGPGPRPLDEVARKHGDDAGDLNSKDESRPLPGEYNPTENKDSGGDEEGDGPNAKSTGEGTGEKYVRSTGLQADGGDFDATKPGAGREADRLLEEKGMRTSGDGDQNGGSSVTTGDKKEKKSIGQKIKDKLHRH